ncbi:nucleotidyltransferase family protein [Psychroserpens luteolus]|uniref:nucleotidyltransferase family protein n=1 Tax=Psychroserpens luteolus TaxID=2855840 RepID=UPI001E659692|nr:nucleotidyltransferase family protein [Psychroserpens luteolus]MCD2257659.1 nucleotidyltransferase family protein [Psychroserpens luteolus]
MSKTNYTYKDTLQLIADILSFEYPNENLKLSLTSATINWEQFVTVASDHLVLPTIYCRLKQKKLLECIPRDLEAYLEDITTINKNRNLGLIEQSKIIADIFNANNIRYAFTKGTAFLIADFYQDNAERMIGDIDILVDENHIFKALDLLLDYGYTKIPSSIRSTFFDHKHLDRLIIDNGLGAVELHKYLLNKPHHNVLSSHMLLNRVWYHKEFPIFHAEDLFSHNILNFQINDRGHYYSKLNMRSTYDSLVLILLFPELIISNTSKYFTSYFSLNSIFFEEFKNVELSQSRINKFISRLKSPGLDSFHRKRLTLSVLLRQIPSRLSTFVTNKKYRKALFNDRKRILKDLNSKFLKP